MSKLYVPHVATLMCEWPIERPSDTFLGGDIMACVRRGWLYLEDAGHGWVRVGLTSAGRLARAALS